MSGPLDRIRVRDVEPKEFISDYALMITDLRTLQYALLLLHGWDLDNARLLALHNDGPQIDAAESRLEKLGFIQIVKG